MIPFITCGVSLCQYVCELVLGVKVLDLDLGVQIDSIKQPIKSNSVDSGNTSHCRASSVYDHLDHCFVVFKDLQQSFLTRRIGRLREQAQHCPDHQSFHEFSFALEIWTGLSVLDLSDMCFREELRRSDPTRPLVMLTWSLQGLLQNQSLQTILIGNVWQCYPHDNIVCIHMFFRNVRDQTRQSFVTSFGP